MGKYKVLDIYRYDFTDETIPIPTCFTAAVLGGVLLFRALSQSDWRTGEVVYNDDRTGMMVRQSDFDFREARAW